MDNFESLRDDHWDHWHEQIGRMRERLQRPIEGTPVYSSTLLFDVKTYDRKRFKAGHRHSKEASEENRYTYWLDDLGRPVRMRFEYRGHEDAGFYEYGSDQVDYIEYSVRAGIPREYVRLVLDDGYVVSMRRIWLNGGGDYPARRHLTVEERAQLFRSTPEDHLVELEEYERDGDKILSGRGYLKWARPPVRYTLAYSYSPKGKLRRIVQQWEGGEQQTVFASRSATPLAELSESLSRLIADHVLKAVAARHSPLQFLELNFRSVDNYLPCVIPAEEGKPEMGPNLACTVDPSEWIELPSNEFEPQLMEFQDRISRASDWDTGARMVRKAARLINQEIQNVCPIADGFFAYALDPECEGSDSTVLVECGASHQQVKTWRQAGWI